MSHQGTMLSTIICLLPLFSHLQPATGETTGELLQSVGKQTQKENYDEIVCTFNLKVSLSRVDFVHKTGSAVFAIVDCGTSCNVLSPYQDVLRIVSPEKTISGDRFVFNATHSDRTTGKYTCHGILAPQVVYTTPSGSGHGDGDGEESQMTSGSPPETDEVSHNAGGSSNGLLALIIIPILLVLIGVVLFLHWRGVIQIPGLPKTRGEPCELRHILENLLQPVIGCWERTRGLCQCTGAENEDPSKLRKSNHEQDEEYSPEAEALLSQNEDKKPLHHGAKPGKSKSDLSYSTEVSFKSDRNDERKDDEMSVVVEHEDAEGKIISPMTVKDIVYRIESTQCIPQTSSAMTEEGRKDKEKIKRINVPLKPVRSEKGMEGTEERKEKESSEAESETISNDDIKAKLTHKRTEDMDERKETNNEKANFEMEEKDITEIKLGTEDKKDTRQKQEQIQETMAAKVEQKDKLETNSEVENAQELEPEAMGEQTPDTRADTVQTSEEKENGSNENHDYETASDADRSGNDEGDVDVDKFDSTKSTGQNLTSTDLSLPEHSQENSEGVKILKDAISKLNPIPNKVRENDDDNSLEV